MHFVSVFDNLACAGVGLAQDRGLVDGDVLKQLFTQVIKGRRDEQRAIGAGLWGNKAVQTCRKLLPHPGARNKLCRYLQKFDECFRILWADSFEFSFLKWFCRLDKAYGVLRLER